MAKIKKYQIDDGLLKSIVPEYPTVTAGSSIVTLIGTPIDGTAVWVMLNEMPQQYGKDFTITDNVITFTFELQEGDIISVLYARK